MNCATTTLTLTELQVRAAILNRFTQLGAPETVRVG